MVGHVVSTEKGYGELTLRNGREDSKRLRSTVKYVPVPGNRDFQSAVLNFHVEPCREPPKKSEYVLGVILAIAITCLGHS